MSKTDVKYPESYKATFEISPQLVVLATQLGIDNMRETIDPDITDDEINELLEKIEIESGRKKYLMEIVRSIVQTRNETDPIQIMNIKIQVLLDNLAKKLCRCTEKDRFTVGYNSSDKIRNNEGLCRASIFQGRNIDYITHDCGEPPENKLRYKYGMGPLLRPALTSDSKVLLRRHSKKLKPDVRERSIVSSITEIPIEKKIAKEIPQLTSAPKLEKSTDIKNCTFKSDNGRCALGEPNMPNVCVYNSETKRCRKK